MNFSGSCFIAGKVNDEHENKITALEIIEEMHILEKVKNVKGTKQLSRNTNDKMKDITNSPISSVGEERERKLIEKH